MRVTDKYTFFYGGTFSNWAPISFREYELERDGSQSYIEFKTSEHYMMWCKALTFQDSESAHKILMADSPRIAKELGRQVKNFNKEKWEAVAKEDVYDGLYLKFTQNESALQELLDTGTTLLVEASPYDLIWGVGWNWFDDEILDSKNWRGTNWLGEVLTKLRDDLVKDYVKNN